MNPLLELLEIQQKEPQKLDNQLITQWFISLVLFLEKPLKIKTSRENYKIVNL